MYSQYIVPVPLHLMTVVPVRYMHVGPRHSALRCPCTLPENAEGREAKALRWGPTTTQPHLPPPSRLPGFHVHHRESPIADESVTSVARQVVPYTAACSCRRREQVYVQYYGLMCASVGGGDTIFSIHLHLTPARLTTHIIENLPQWGAPGVR